MVEAICVNNDNSYGLVVGKVYKVADTKDDALKSYYQVRNDYGNYAVYKKWRFELISNDEE